jgi:hypothetical integral membrane protein (TIGR02206 family)
MDQFFSWDYTGAPFKLFDSIHLIALAVAALYIFGLTTFRKHPNPTVRRNVRYVLAAILVIDEILWHVWHLVWGHWTVQEMLPLHLCSVLVWIGAYMLVTKSYLIYEIMYFLGIAGALQALLTPDVGIYGFPHYRFFQCFLSHSTIVGSAIYMTVVEGYRPTWRSFWRVALMMNLYMGFVMVVNTLLGSNYLFIARKPDTPTLIDLLGPWPWYILALEAIGLVLCFLLYVPFIIKDGQRQKYTLEPRPGAEPT